MESGKHDPKIIKVDYDGITKNLVANGNKISKTTISDSFCVTGGSLSCSLQGEQCYTPTDEQNFFLIENIDVYTLTINKIENKNESISDARNERLRTYLNKIYDSGEPASSSSVKNRKKICSKKADVNESATINTPLKVVQVAKSSRKRVIYVKWWHKDLTDTQHLPKTKSSFPVYFLENKSYTVAEIISSFKVEIIKNTAYDNADFENCHESLGLPPPPDNDEGKVTVINDFLNENKQICTIWDFVKIHKGNKRSFILYLLTEEVKKVEPAENFRVCKTGIDTDSSEKSFSFPTVDIFKIPTATDVSQNTARSLKSDVHSNINSAISSYTSQIFGSAVVKGNSINNSNMIRSGPLTTSVIKTKASTRPESGKRSYSHEYLNKIAEATSSKVTKILEDEQEKTEKENRVPQIETHNLSLVSKIQFPELTINYNELLGKGTFGEVYIGVWLRKKYAVKCIDFDGSEERLLIREISILAALSHDNIVRLSAVCIKKPKLYIVMELFKSESLKEVLYNDRVKQQFALDGNSKIKILSQICQAILYLHYKTVIHRDIKPGNILVNKNFDIKICDFGFSKIGDLATGLMTTKGKKHVVGTKMYLAPELLLKFEEATVHSDMWALGCTLVEIFKERLTWDEELENRTMTEILQNKLVPSFVGVPQFLEKVLLDCFSYDKLLRPTAEMILNSLPTEF